MKDLTVYITTCDANIFITKYFQYFFNKYWSKDSKVKILGFNEPDFELSPNFEFVSIGEEQKGGAKGWSNYLIDYFSQIEDEFFIFGIDDFIVSREVDMESLEVCIDLMDKSIGRIDLQPSLQYARDPKFVTPYKVIDGVKFLQLAQSGGAFDLYQNSGAFSIWNRKWFLKNIKRDWSPWDWEIKGSQMANNDGYLVLGVEDRWPVKKLELLSGRAWPGVINTTGIRSNDLEEMKNLRKESDRIKKFENITKGYGYNRVGPKWLDVIFGE
jgi:hypothetical protein